ncbi:MAG: Maf family protein [Pirellulales bacterium]|nr:Maf family protein [Pirellulales bacterium]
MAQLRLILASGSPQRQELLGSTGYSFDVVVPDDAAECGRCSSSGPASFVAELAFRKAADVARQLAEREKRELPSLLVACDTVAECGGVIFGKPHDEDHARQMLVRLRGQIHRVYSGLCIWPHNLEASPETRIAVTELRMDLVADEALEKYLASGLWRGKAGAFGYQDRVGWLHIEQGSPSNVIGLPIELLDEMLKPWKSQLAHLQA